MRSALDPAVRSCSASRRVASPSDVPIGSEDDPVVGVFLSFLAEDMQNHPGRLTTLSLALAERIAGLIEDVDVDPGAAIEGSVAV